jgi:hypothetical protein
MKKIDWGLFVVEVGKHVITMKTTQKDSKDKSMATWSEKTKKGEKGGSYGPSPLFLVEKNQRVVLNLCRSSHMKNECPNQSLVENTSFFIRKFSKKNPLK